VWNITTLCSGHHHQLHDGALEIRGKAPDALVFTWRARDAVGMALAGKVEAREAMPVEADAPAATAATIGAEVATGAKAAVVEARDASMEAAAVTADDESAEVEAASDVNDREAGPRQATIEEEARQALVSAGYSPRVARAAVASSRPHVGDRATLEQLLRASLRAAPDCR